MTEADFSRTAVGERLGRYRELAGYTQDQVTERFNLGTRVLAGWEQGRAVPSDFELHRLAGLYGTHAAVLRYGDNVLKEAALADASGAIRRAALGLQALALRLELDQPNSDQQIADLSLDKPEGAPITNPPPKKRRKAMGGP